MKFGKLLKLLSRKAKPSAKASAADAEVDLSLIKLFEGLELTAYLCPAGVWTIGYGHTLTAKRGMEITAAQADALLVQDVAWVKRAVESGVRVPITPNQKAALYSFVYNVGAGAFRSSTLLRILNDGASVSEVQAQFMRWNKAGGKTLRGLTRRRRAEVDLFGRAA